MKEEQTFHPTKIPMVLSHQLDHQLTNGSCNSPYYNKPLWKAELIPVKIIMAVKEMVTILACHQSLAHIIWLPSSRHVPFEFLGISDIVLLLLICRNVDIALATS